MKALSIRQHVALITLLPLLLLSVALAGLYLYYRFDELERQLELRSTALVKEFSINSAHAIHENNGNLLNNITVSIQSQEDVLSVVLWGAELNPLVLKGDWAASYSVLFTEDNARALSNAVFTEISSLNKNHLLVYQAISPALIGLDGEYATQTQGYALVVVDRQIVSEQKKELLLLVLIILLLVLIIPSYLLYSAGRNISRPIELLSGLMRMLAEGKGDVLPSLDSNIVEMQRLCSDIQQVASQLHQERNELETRVALATEELTQQKEKAERESSERGHFLAVASHDLRQPIHALGLYVSELERKLSLPSQFQLLEKIQVSLESLDALLSVLLDISKLDAGVVLPQYKTCQIKQIFEQVAANFEVLAAQKNITLRVIARSFWLTSDCCFLERILSNLLSNAIRYTQAGGKVMLLCRQRQGKLRIEVRDNGAGISLADQQKIFQAFVQLAEPKFRGADKGMGLGLAIVDRLTRLLDSEVKLYSKQGKGALFYFDLSILKDQNRTLVALPEPDLLFDNEPQAHSVLVVDDDPLVRFGTANVLTTWGFDVEMAGSLEGVKQLLQQDKTFDLVICDYHLEYGVTGLQVLQYVQQQLGAVPCIIISGETGQDLVTQANERGYALLHKPVKPAKLRSLILYKLRNDS